MEKLIAKIERLVQPTGWAPNRKASERKVFRNATAKAIYELIQEYKKNENARKTK